MRKLIKNICIMVLYTPMIVLYLAIIYAVLFINQANPWGRLKRTVSVCSKRFTFHLLVTLLGHWFPNPIYIKYNRKILKYRKTITISNHCSDYDWFFLLIVFHEFGIHDSRILLKKSLGSIPVVGFIVRKFGHICLNRARSRDIQIIKKAIRPISKSPNYNITLYPEGTYLFPDALQSTRKFARETKLEVDNEPFIPNLVLLPRKTGFNLITNILDDDYDGIIDITIMMNPYVYMPCEDCPPFELFFNQKLVMNQFMLVDFVPRSEITKDFLERSFKRKEERIRAYIDYTQEPVDSERKFLDTIDKIEKIGEDEETKTILVYSPYGPMLFIFPVALIIAVYFSLRGR